MVTLGASWGSAICNWELLWGDTGEQGSMYKKAANESGTAWDFSIQQKEAIYSLYASLCGYIGERISITWIELAAMLAGSLYFFY